MHRILDASATDGMTNLAGGQESDEVKEGHPYFVEIYVEDRLRVVYLDRRLLARYGDMLAALAEDFSRLL
jgi:hypothetical protein